LTQRSTRDRAVERSHTRSAARFKCRTIIAGSVYLAGCVISGGTSIMITYMRTAVALSGKSLEFVAFAKEMAEIIGRVTGTKPVVATRLGGNANEIAWISHPESLAQLEEIAAKLMADPDYRAGLKKAEHLAVPGMTHDQIWRQV
jgi:hypothetical protein